MAIFYGVISWKKPKSLYTVIVSPYSKKAARGYFHERLRATSHNSRLWEATSCTVVGTKLLHVSAVLGAWQMTGFIWKPMVFSQLSASVLQPGDTWLML